MSNEQPSAKPKYTGVSWHSGAGKWAARGRDPTRQTNIALGLFSDERAAAEAYDCAVLLLRGHMATTNFESETYTPDALNHMR